MYKTVHTDSYREEGGYRIDIHYVHTENGYHYDAALWQAGHLIDDKGEFATRVEAIRWAQGQIKSAEQDKEPAPTMAAYVTPYSGKPYVRGYSGGTIGEELEDGPMEAYFRF